MLNAENPFSEESSKFPRYVIVSIQTLQNIISDLNRVFKSSILNQPYSSSTTTARKKSRYRINLLLPVEFFIMTLFSQCSTYPLLCLLALMTRLKYVCSLLRHIDQAIINLLRVYFFRSLTISLNLFLINNCSIIIQSQWIAYMTQTYQAIEDPLNKVSDIS